PRAGLPLVAARPRVPVVRAARALKQVAPDGRRVAKLRGRAGEQRLGKARGEAADLPVLRDRGVRRERADLDRAVAHLDAAEIELAHVDHALRTEHLDLHQIDEIGAAGEKRRAVAGGDGVVEAGRTLEGEEAHQALPETSRM